MKLNRRFSNEFASATIPGGILLNSLKSGRIAASALVIALAVTASIAACSSGHPAPIRSGAPGAGASPSSSTVIVDGKNFPISTPVECLWSSDHTCADMKAKEAIASVESNGRDAEADMSKSWWEVTFGEDPGQPPEVSSVGILTPDMNWEYQRPPEYGNSGLVAGGNATATKVGNHYTFTGSVQAFGNTSGTVPMPNPPQYAPFRIEAECQTNGRL